MFNIGISTSQELDNHFITMAVLWDSRKKPNFTLQGITLEEAKEYFPAVIVIQNSNLICSINAACNRAVEQLIIRELIPVGTKPEVNLLVTSNAHTKNIILKTVKHRRHWLITVSRRLLNLWLNGER